MEKYNNKKRKKNLEDKGGLGLDNVLKTGPVIEPEKLLVHGSLVGPVDEPWLNR